MRTWAFRLVKGILFSFRQDIFHSILFAYKSVFIVADGSFKEKWLISVMLVQRMSEGNTDYLCDIPCRVTWIPFNQLWNLVIIKYCMLVCNVFTPSRPKLPLLNPVNAVRHHLHK